jgi:hypothetical protein
VDLGKAQTVTEKKELALRQFNSEIATTISERRLHWIMTLDTPHARLRKLKNQLSPSTAECNDAGKTRDPNLA